MGVFMASVAFRCDEKNDWRKVKPKIEEMFKGLNGLVDNLDSVGSCYAIVSPYGDMGMFLAELPAKISKLTKGYVAFTSCVDSDFATIELYRDGELLERSCIGEVYEEFAEFCGANAPNAALWAPLLINPRDENALAEALLGKEVFVEDQLRTISRLTGLPIFDDAMIF